MPGFDPTEEKKDLIGGDRDAKKIEMGETTADTADRRSDAVGSLTIFDLMKQKVGGKEADAKAAYAALMEFKVRRGPDLQLVANYST